MSSHNEVPAEFLAFTLGSEEYGINLKKIQELRSYERVTQLAGTPDYVKGVVNLRGAIVPVLDMRIKLHTGAAIYDQFTSVIVINLANQVVGMVVDSVLDVIMLKPEQIKPAPEMGGTRANSYITGIGAFDDRMLVLVDIDRLLALDDDLSLIEKLAA